MKFVVTLFLAWILLPITGDGSRENPYRPNLPLTVREIPNLRWSAHIPSNADGTPKFTDAYVWIPDNFTLPGSVVVINTLTARTQIKARDPNVSLTGLEMP